MWFPYGDGAVTIVGIKGGGPEREPSIIAEKEAQEFKEFGGRFLRTMQSERKLVSLILPKNHTISAGFFGKPRSILLFTSAIWKRFGISVWRTAFLGCTIFELECPDCNYVA